jgi:hypothetical protein
MALLHPEDRVAVTTPRILVKSMIAVILFISSVVSAPAQQAQPPNTNESWTAITDSVDNYNSLRTTESHVKDGNRILDKRTVAVPGPNGGYQLDSETEKETIQVDATTTRTVERAYRWDVNGRRYLVQVTEEEARTSATGDAQVVRTVSNSDGYGNLQTTQREVAETRKTSPNTQETKFTLYLPDGNGYMTPYTQTQELQTRTDDHTVKVNKTMLRQVSSGGPWEVGEVRESTIKEDGKNRTTEERVSRSDLNGRFSDVSRTVGKETEAATGVKSSIVETYSAQIPGLAPDGNLHLNQRVTTVQKNDRGGSTTEQQVEQPYPFDPNVDQQVTKRTKYIVQYAASGTQATKTVQVRDINGKLNVVFEETRKSDQVPPEQAQAVPSSKPQ